MKTLQMLLDFINAYNDASTTEKHICKDVIDATFVPKHVEKEIAKLPEFAPAKTGRGRRLWRRKPTNNKKTGSHEKFCVVCWKKFNGMKNSSYCADKECKKIMIQARQLKYSDKRNLYIIQPMANYIQTSKDNVLSKQNNRKWNK